METSETHDKDVQQIILFRSKLTDQAGADYQAMNAELETFVRQNPGFVDVKGYPRKTANGSRWSGGGMKSH